MTEAKIDGIVSTLAPATLTYSSIDKPKAFNGRGKETGEPKYEATLVFDLNSPAIQQIKAKAAEVAKAKWPGVDLATIIKPWKDGTEYANDSAASQKTKGKDPKAFDEFARGKLLLTGRSKFQPRLAGLEGNKIVDYDTDVAKAANYKSFYAGVEVLVELNFVAYDPIRKGDRAGVACYLNGIVTLKRGEKLGGGASMAERFSGYVGQASGEDPTKGSEAW
jgi:hypothetical protein